MASINALTAVGKSVAAGVSWTLHAPAEARPAAMAHAAAGAAAAINPQRKRRNATATGQSVNRGFL